jgi:uncharacterized MnhB-related membrane protein
VNGATIVLLLLPVTAVFALAQRRRLYAIIGMSVFSLLLSAVYLFAAAPDVAITEAAIGAALVTFIYVLAIRRTGRITVAASEAPGLLHRDGESVVGLEWEILDEVARGLGLDLVFQFVPHEDVIGLVSRGDADVGAGGLILDAALPARHALGTPSYLPTARFAIRGPKRISPGEECPRFRGYFSDLVDTARRGDRICVTLDLARFLALSRHGMEGYEATRCEEDLGYSFAVSEGRPAIHRRLEREIERLRKTGRLDRMIERHLS